MIRVVESILKCCFFTLPSDHLLLGDLATFQTYARTDTLFEHDDGRILLIRLPVFFSKYL